jgi:hypothetical protein
MLSHFDMRHACSLAALTGSMGALMPVLSVGVTVPGVAATKLGADSVEDRVTLETLAAELHPDANPVVAVDAVAIDAVSAAAAAGALMFEFGS